MKHSKLIIFSQAGIIVFLILLLAFCSGSPANQKLLDENPEENTAEVIETEEDLTAFIHLPGKDLPVSEFEEIWAYVVAGREAALVRGLPLTDIGYFGAEIDSYGKLTDVPRRSALNFPGRVHLVVACNGRALSYFTLREGSEERKALIADLLAAARNYDGLQIDFENVPTRSAQAYLSFLIELRAGLPADKMFTVALAARTRRIADDVYDYQNILPHVDRILVMAYDEHWSGSRPGSVASIDWCRRVADYSFRTIGREKLIMGLPFYGRAWGDYSPSRALVHSSIENIINDNKVTDIKYENGIPTFTYNKNVSTRVFFEDEYSLSSRMSMYESMDVRAIGFWRLGQETKEVWKYLRLSGQ
ncbi:MAG: glycoside hydrolase [Treponema sp.]|jgi:hypothetical protein|nr:glycoside hydrolase [Treponema sp.]